MNRQIVFFDGVCNLCNGFVDFLIRRDVTSSFYFSSLQGETAKKTLSDGATKALNSVVLWSQGEAFYKSDAVLMIFKQMGLPWSLFWIFWPVPTFMRNFCYDLVAKNRYWIWGKKETCRLPTPEERAHFLP